ncbi:MAG: DedA family protein [Deltaproteobacteria bacterium]|nr:DedA family protein [Deltaproteobacteria bacterium]
MDYILALFDFIMRIDKHLAEITAAYGALTYIILFLIVFCETGLVVLPILPGDSMLFAAGAIASTGSMNPHFMFLALFIAAVIGDAVNYHIGAYLGERAFDPNHFTSRFFKKQYLEKTQKFYDKYGGKTIIIARFVPIVRTFAPFLAGVGGMKYRNFFIYNVTGGFLWTSLFIYAGYFFGEIPVVKRNFTLVIIAIIILSVMPAVIEYLKARKESKKAAYETAA